MPFYLHSGYPLKLSANVILIYWLTGINILWIHKLKLMTFKSVRVPISETLFLEGDLKVPLEAKSLVIFSHGSGSSRFSPRNNYVAEKLNNAGIGTLLIDLLTQLEDVDNKNRFNINILTDRLSKVTLYINALPDFSKFSLGYFGASTGAASAINSAAHLGDMVQAVVSRGGRPDLADTSLLLKISCPVLLLVGGLDTEVLQLNKFAYSLLKHTKKLVVIEDAFHLFEEPGKLEEVAVQATDWFNKYLRSPYKTHAISK
jgi:putative phosphoribosyl transferase